jgi:hypothetical protein
MNEAETEAAVVAGDVSTTRGMDARVCVCVCVCEERRRKRYRERGCVCASRELDRKGGEEERFECSVCPCSGIGEKGLEE